MTKREFEKRIIEMTAEYLGEGYDIKIDAVRKDNAVTYHTLIIEKGALKISAALNIDMMFSCYKAGLPFSRISEELKKLLERQLAESSWLKEKSKEITDFSKSIPNVVFRLVNYEKNMDRLETVPHRRIEDLAVVYYVLVGDWAGSCITAAVNHKLMEEWKTDEETLYQAACANTPKLLPMEFHDISSILESMLLAELKLKLERKETGFQVHVSLEDDNHVLLYDMTNSSENFGAAVVLYPQALQNAAERLGSDLVIFPSSVHEVLVLPLNEHADLAYFQYMVESVNQESVASEDFLSDNVYCYIREEGTFRLMTKDDERRYKAVTAA